MSLTYIKVFYDWLDAVEPLNDEERGRLFTGLLTYARTGEVPALQGSERFLFPVFRAQLDRDAASYAKKSKTLSEAGRKGGLIRAAQAKGGLASYGLASHEEEKEKEKEKYKYKYYEKDKEEEEEVPEEEALPHFEPFAPDPVYARAERERMDRFLKDLFP